MKPICEICHKKPCIGTKWINADESPIFVGGIYRVCEDCGGTKNCTKCKITKPLDQFGKEQVIGTYKSDCKQCHNQYNKEYMKKNRDRINEYNRRYRQHRKQA